MSKVIESKKTRDKIMMPVKIMIGSLVVFILFNLFCPMYTENSFSISFKYTIISSLLLGYGVLGTVGRFKQNVPLAAFSVIKLAQLGLALMFADGGKLLPLPFIVSCVLGLGINILLMIDRDRFHIESEES